MILALTAVLYSAAALAQSAAPPAAETGQPAAKAKPAKQDKAAKPAAKGSVAVRLQACQDIDDGTKERLTCYDGVIPPAPKPKAATSSSSSAASGGGSDLKLSADPSGALKFDKSKLAAKSGAVTITMNNPSSVPHGIAVEGNGVDKDGQIVNSGGTSTVSVSLKPGKYEFYCPVDSHKQQGMEGTLTVT